MRIGIDARLFGLEHTGIGRYVMKLVESVLKNDKKNEYVLFLTKKYAPQFQGKSRIKVVVTSIPIYSFQEQILLPYIFGKEHLDLLHVPHFNAPLFYRGKMILTVHDLIKHHSTGSDTTTRSPWLYFIKRTGYLFLTKLVTLKADHILVPSFFVKKDIENILKVKPDKVSVTYEAVDSNIKESILNNEEKGIVLSKFGLAQPFVVYTGNVYPHKNVDILIDAIVKHNQTKEVDLQLALICSRSVFWERLNKKIQDRNIGHWIKMLGYVDDANVSKIYSFALGLVHPSKMEGFGLPGLEAMKLGLPVLSSNASCLPEIYGDAALYFDPDSLDDIVLALETLIQDGQLRETLSIKGYQQARKYSWNKMGEQTLVVYRKLIKK